MLGLDLGPHAGFIESAYAIALALVGGMTVWVIADHRRQARRLAELEARGEGRRAAFSGRVDSGFPPENATLPPPG
jgi:heme exporter protein D